MRQIDPTVFAPENNLHHTDTEIKTDDELLEEMFGRGPGDPDVHGYPGDESNDSD